MGGKGAEGAALPNPPAAGVGTSNPPQTSRGSPSPPRIAQRSGTFCSAPQAPLAGEGGGKSHWLLVFKPWSSFYIMSHVTF